MVNPLPLVSTLCINVMVMNKMLPLLIDISSPVMVTYPPLTSKPHVFVLTAKEVIAISMLEQQLQYIIVSWEQKNINLA